MKRLVLFLFLFLHLPSAQAEYRAFLLKITSPPSENPEKQEKPTEPTAQPAFRLVKSNLDHLQYKQYYPILAGEKVEYIDTWMCRGSTAGMTPICKSPREIASESNPAPATSPESSLETK